MGLLPETRNRLWDRLDPRGKAILSYLSRNRHADIHSLAEAMGDACHMDVLTTIEDVVNPTAEQVLGSPLVVFQQSRYDPLSGKRVCFHWWLAHEIEPVGLPLWGPADVMESANAITVVIDMHDTPIEMIEIQVETQGVVVSSSLPGRVGEEKIPLPVPVEPAGAVMEINNGFLVLHIPKRMREG